MSDYLPQCVVSPRVLILGYSEAAMLLRKGNVDVQAIIAIHGQREFAVETNGIAKSLILQFDDTESPRNDDPIHAARLRIRQREAADFGLTLSPPTVEHARQIISFAESLHGMSGILLCHCFAGVSRSPAAALLCLTTWTGPEREMECIREVMRIRPCAIPHRDLVAFGDELLGRNGMFLASLTHH